MCVWWRSGSTLLEDLSLLLHVSIGIVSVCCLYLPFPHFIDSLYSLVLANLCYSNLILQFILLCMMLSMLKFLFESYPLNVPRPTYLPDKPLAPESLCRVCIWVIQTKTGMS